MVVKVERESQSASPEPQSTLAQYPGERVENPVVLWVGAGNFFSRLVKAGTFRELLERHGAYLTVIDIRSGEEVGELPKHANVRYYDVSKSEQRRNLVYNRFNEEGNRVFTHIYIATWPQAHLLSAVKYSTLCPGGDIIITKPLDMNIPMVKEIEKGVFPDLTEKMTVDDHYRNKGSIRALHAKMRELILEHSYGRLWGFRMWLVEPTTIEAENRLQALECGVIWDLATHLISLIQLFFLDLPYVALQGYTHGDPRKIHQVQLEIRKVLRKQYVGCQLTDGAETLAVIEVAVTFLYDGYKSSVRRTVPGLLVVGKAASRGKNIEGPVKQLDFQFERGPINLNYNTGTLWPAIYGFAPTSETGFCQPVTELLTYTQRRQKVEEASFGVRVPEPGQYHCGMPFSAAFRNVMLTNEVIDHPSGRNLLHSYTAGSDIRDIMNDLVAQDFLEKEKNWMIERDFGKFV